MVGVEHRGCRDRFENAKMLPGYRFEIFRISIKNYTVNVNNYIVIFRVLDFLYYYSRGVCRQVAE